MHNVAVLCVAEPFSASHAGMWDQDLTFYAGPCVGGCVRNAQASVLGRHVHLIIALKVHTLRVAWISYI